MDHIILVILLALRAVICWQSQRENFCFAKSEKILTLSKLLKFDKSNFGWGGGINKKPISKKQVIVIVTKHKKYAFLFRYAKGMQ